MSRYVLGLTCVLAITVGGASPAFSEPRQVLLLYDERTTLPGLSILDSTLTRALTAGAQEEIDIYREAMELSRFPSDTHLEVFRDYLRAKYAEKNIEVVIAVMGPALDFLLANGSVVFPETPIVFSGIDRRELGDRPLPSRVTGVVLKREFSPTLEIALKLHPGTRRVIFVAGTSDFDTRLVAAARDELQGYEARVEITYLTELPFARLLEELSMLPPGNVVLYSSLFQDGAGMPFVPHEAVERISAAASVPVYGFVDQYLGRGIVGGHVYTLEQHGREAAHLALQILAGSKPSELPLSEPRTGETIFDWRQLRRWDLDQAALPPGSVVRFRGASLWDRYGIYVIGAVVLFALQALMIGALLLQRARRRRMASELRESEFRFRTMADTAPVMIWVAGVDGRFTFLNKGWLSFTGSTVEQQLGEAWTGRVHPDEIRKCVALYEKSLDAKKDFSLECRLRRHDGIYRWVLCAGVPRYSQEGMLLGYIGSCIDVTERKEAALEMQRHHMDLAHMNRVASLGELTASVAHELNQPLAAILSNAGAAEMILDTDLPSVHELKEILADIRMDGRRAAEVIRGLRSFLQKHDIRRNTVEIGNMLEEIVHLLSIEAVARKVAITLEPSGDRTYVSGDRVHLQQVMMNLVLNGFDAMAMNPESERRLGIKVENRGDQVLISISDQGIGIPPDLLAKVFEPFFTTKEKGLGMGLSIARTIVEAHQGKIWAENNKDAGATFYVMLPVLRSV